MSRILNNKEVFYLLFVTQFYSLCNKKEWSDTSLAFVYNLDKEWNEKVTGKELNELIESGKIDIVDFAYLLKAVKGDRVFD